MNEFIKCEYQKRCNKEATVFFRKRGFILENDFVIAYCEYHAVQYSNRLVRITSIEITKEEYLIEDTDRLCK